MKRACCKSGTILNLVISVICWLVSFGSANVGILYQKAAKKGTHSVCTMCPMKKVIENLFSYFSFFQSFDISSRVLPFVSGTSFHTNTAARTQITP